MPSEHRHAGDTQVWGLLGCQKEAAFAAERVIVVVEELVDEAVIRADPNRTIIPGLIVDAVVVEPWGAHPSYVQGAYDRDNRFYLDWDAITRDEAALQAWLREWVFDLDGRAAYVEKLGGERVAALRARSRAIGVGRLRVVSMTEPTTFSKSEMMIVAAARELAGQHVCFVGRRSAEHRGQPRPADGGARPRARLRGGRLRGAAGAAAAVDRRPDDRDRRDRGRQHARAVRLLPAARTHRRRLPRRGPDRPVRQHQHDRHRPVRPPDDTAAGFRWRLRDRDQRPPGLRDHAPDRAQLRRDDRLPDLAGQPRWRRAGERIRREGGWLGRGPERRRDRPRHLPLR